MNKINFDPIATFPNGSVAVSTHHSGDDRFTCELFEASQDAKAHWDPRMVSNHFEARPVSQLRRLLFNMQNVCILSRELR